MHNETQALHLARMMQKHTRYPSYELALPLITVQGKKLKKLSVDDVLLTGFDSLKFLLIDGDTICAKMELKQIGQSYVVEIFDLDKDTIKANDSKKYKTLNITFGTVQSKVLEVGHTIDIRHIELDNVKLVLEGKEIAEATLVNVDEEIAIQIKKVN